MKQYLSEVSSSSSKTVWGGTQYPSLRLVLAHQRPFGWDTVSVSEVSSSSSKTVRGGTQYLSEVSTSSSKTVWGGTQYPSLKLVLAHQRPFGVGHSIRL